LSSAVLAQDNLWIARNNQSYDGLDDIKSGAEITSLWDVYNKKELYYADALAILMQIGEVNGLPEIDIPNTSGSYSQVEETNRSVEKPSWLSTYPNPAKESTFLNYPKELDEHGEIKITNTLGQVVFSIVPKSKGILEIDLSDFETGMYIITIHLGSEQIDELKLIKE